MQFLSEAAAEVAAKEGRKVLRYEDVASAVQQDERLAFLSGIACVFIWDNRADPHAAYSIRGS